jgi:uncharacterized protein (TIGR02996 family)
MPLSARGEAAVFGTQTVSDDLAFIRGLLANPEDNSLRLVYADWLEDRGDPRSTFLRLEVALHETEPASRSGDLRERLHQARSDLDARWLALIDRPQAGWRIVRMGTPPKVYGKAIPAFIHNGDYFLSTVDTYADGAINCWGFVDLPLFRGKLAQGWVVPRAEMGGTLSIHNLGQARVAAAQWDLTTDDLERNVKDTLREFNPAMEGLLDMQGTDTEIRNGVRYAKGAGLGGAKPYRITLAGEEVAGAELPVLEVVADGYRLRRWLIYADGLTQLGYANELTSPELVARMFEEGRLTLSVPAEAWVTLDGLGRFQAGEGFWFIEPGERLREASDLLEQLRGGSGAIRRCIEAHRAYRSGPNRERREALREAYEAVPRHLRRFCGDMDSKDGPIRRVLAGSQDEEGPE